MYTPYGEYAEPHDAITRRIRAGYGKQRAGLQQDLATRGVATSGVSSIPLAELGNEEELAVGDNDARFALQDIGDRIDDRHRTEDFARERESDDIASARQSALQRRLLGSQLLGGGIGLLGAFASRGGSTRKLPGWG